MNLASDKKLLLLNQTFQQQPQQFKTITDMLGFEAKEESFLRSLLSSHLSDVAGQNVMNQDIIFDKEPPEHYPRAIKQQWNKESYSVLTAQKRCKTLITIIKKNYIYHKSIIGRKTENSTC